MSATLKQLNANSEIAKQQQALAINISAARSLQNLLKTNLGPRGTLKMLVSGAGDIRMTKDGQVLLSDMQIQHPTAALIARTATAQDDITGDGTTTTVLLVGEMLNQAQRYLYEGTHPSVLIEGLFLAKNEAKKFLDLQKEEILKKIPKLDREILVSVARTALRTKLHESLADKMADIVVDAVHCVSVDDKPIDLHMVELMHMQHRMDTETEFVNGLVLDHGARHPDMKKDMKNCYILTLNDSLEYEKTEVNANMQFSDAESRQKLVEAERRHVDEKVRKIVELKKKVCDESKDKEPKNFIVINQKGIDPMSLDVLCKNGISALRRAKRRNMERIPLAFGGEAVNSVENLTPDDLGFCDHYYEQTLGEDMYTFLVNEKSKKGKSCTILMRGPDKHTIAQIKDAVRDGLRAVTNALDDKVVIPGAGSFEVALSEHLQNFTKTVEGRAQLGVKCFAEAVLIIPKVLSQNSGFDPQEKIISLAQANNNGQIAGLDIYTGEIINPIQSGIFDNFKVKQQTLEASTFTATQLLYVDEILKAARAAVKKE